MGAKLEAVLGVLNGAVGDYLARTHNGLALEMALVRGGELLPLDAVSLARAFPKAPPRVSVWVHGLMATEEFWRFPGGGDYGARLQQDLGVTPLYVRFNSGRAIADNGVLLAELLESLVTSWPGNLDDILLVGHSMGGLVIRSACHQAAQAKHRWLARVHRAIYLGTPHQGAPMERVGRVLAAALGVVNDPYTQLLADLANLRSDGVKDLGDADLRHQDRAVHRKGVSLRSPRHPVPLLPGIRHHLVAGAVSSDPRWALLLGDAVVPLSSATDGHHRGKAGAGPLPPERIKIFHGLSHPALAHHPDVYAQIRAWAEAP